MTTWNLGLGFLYAKWKINKFEWNGEPKGDFSLNPESIQIWEGMPGDFLPRHVNRLLLFFLL